MISSAIHGNIHGWIARSKEAADGADATLGLEPYKPLSKIRYRHYTSPLDVPVSLPASIFDFVPGTSAQLVPKSVYAKRPEPLFFVSTVLCWPLRPQSSLNRVRERTDHMGSERAADVLGGPSKYQAP